MYRLDTLFNQSSIFDILVLHSFYYIKWRYPIFYIHVEPSVFSKILLQLKLHWLPAKKNLTVRAFLLRKIGIGIVHYFHFPPHPTCGKHSRWQWQWRWW
jgi:hypothetical protein